MHFAERDCHDVIPILDLLRHCNESGGLYNISKKTELNCYNRMTCLATSLPKSFHFEETTYRCLSKLAYLQIDDVATSEQHMVLMQIFNYYVNELELDSSSWFNHHEVKKIINATMDLHERLLSLRGFQFGFGETVRVIAGIFQNTARKDLLSFSGIKMFWMSNCKSILMNYVRDEKYLPFFESAFVDVIKTHIQDTHDSDTGDCYVKYNFNETENSFKKYCSPNPVDLAMDKKFIIQKLASNGWNKETVWLSSESHSIDSMDQANSSNASSSYSSYR